MAEMLKLSDWEFKTTVINMLRALMDKVDSMQEQIGNINRDGNPLKEPKKKKKNARDRKHCNRNVFD